MRTSFSLLCRAINHQLGEMNRCPSELDAPAGIAITWPAGARADTGAAEIKKNEAWRQTEPYPCTLSLVSSGLPPHWARLKWKGTQNIFQSVTWGEGEEKREEEMITPGLLTNLCRTELVDSISVSEHRALRDSRRDRSSGKRRGSVWGTALCSLLFNGVILLKVMTQPYWGFHSAFRCS